MSTPSRSLRSNTQVPNKILELPRNERELRRGRSAENTPSRPKNPVEPFTMEGVEEDRRSQHSWEELAEDEGQQQQQQQNEGDEKGDSGEEDGRKGRDSKEDRDSTDGEEDADQGGDTDDEDDTDEEEYSSEGSSEDEDDRHRTTTKKSGKGSKSGKAGDQQQPVDDPVAQLQGDLRETSDPKDAQPPTADPADDVTAQAPQATAEPTAREGSEAPAQEEISGTVPGISEGPESSTALIPAEETIRFAGEVFVVKRENLRTVSPEELNADYDSYDDPTGIVLGQTAAGATRAYIAQMLSLKPRDILERFKREQGATTLMEMQLGAKKVLNGIVLQEAIRRGWLSVEEAQPYRDWLQHCREQKCSEATALRHRNNVAQTWGTRALKLLMLSINKGATKPRTWLYVNSLLNKRPEWEDARAKLMYTIFKRLTHEKQGRSTVINITPTDIEQALKRKDEDELSEEQLAEAGLEYDTHGFLKRVGEPGYFDSAILQSVSYSENEQPGQGRASKVLKGTSVSSALSGVEEGEHARGHKRTLSQAHIAEEDMESEVEDVGNNGPEATELEDEQDDPLEEFRSCRCNRLPKEAQRKLRETLVSGGVPGQNYPELLRAGVDRLCGTHLKFLATHFNLRTDDDIDRTTLCVRVIEYLKGFAERYRLCARHPDWFVRRVMVDQNFRDMPLICEVLPDTKADQIMLTFHYDRSIISQSDVEGFLSAFSRLLNHTLFYPYGQASDPASLTEGELSLLRNAKPPQESRDNSLGGIVDGEEPTIQLTPEAEDIRRLLANLAKVDPSHISPSTTIFQLGLDSINALQIATQLSALGYCVSATDVLEHPSVYGLEQALRKPQVDELNSSNQAFNFADYEDSQKPKLCQSASLPQSAIKSVMPCTPVQSGMLALFMSSEGSVYFNHMVLKYAAGVDSDTIRAAWERAMHRHDMLRTGFFHTGEKGIPFAAATYTDGTFSLPWQQSACLKPGSEELASLRSNLAKTALSKLHVPPWFVTLQVDSSGHLLQFSALHALYDAQSLGLILSDVSSFLTSQTLPEPVPVRGIQETIINEALADDMKSKDFWSSLLSDLNVTKLPDLNPLHAREAPVQKQATITSQSSLALLQEKCKEAKVSLQAACQAAWAKLLAAYTGESSVTCGVVLSGRSTLSEAGGAVFPCLVTLPVSYVVSGTNEQLLKRVMDLNVELIKHQFTPIAKIREWLKTDSPLFSTLFVFQKLGSPMPKDVHWTVVDEEASIDVSAHRIL
ncbi:putative Hybrid PKS-NRPS biosynthetic cluster [Ascosphaera atra]|nr:putative Hybrid PKS-NRPS biosynthetic cluster [Ascosphaera atra]